MVAMVKLRLRRVWGAGVWLALLALVALVGSACSGTGATPVAGTPGGVTPAASETAGAQASPLPAATDTAAPQDTAEAPEATEAGPTAAAPSDTPPASPTTAVVNPLTGLAVPDASVLERRPLAIKVAHFPRSVREDQVGLSQADNIWEHYAEGGTTRFTAIFLSQGPERIGNVRSARLIDAYLGQAYQAMLVASGSSSGTMARLRETDFYDRVIAEYTGYTGCPLLCREESAAVSSHKLYTSAPAVWQLADEMGLNGRPDLAGFVFDPQAPAGGEPASTIHIDFHVNQTVTEWRYDPARQLYDRWIDTNNMPELAQHVDAANGQALSAANVVVLFVPYITANTHEVEGGQPYASYDVPLVGSGRALLFRDGQMYELTWQRDEDAGGLPLLLDEAGNTVALRPGITWFTPLDPDSPNTFEDGQFWARIKVPGV